MNRTAELHNLGQRLWLDNISRQILDDGTLRRYIDEFSITGLTSNPTIFNEAINKTAAYDQGIREKTLAGMSGEALFTELALEDLRRAADWFEPMFQATEGLDGWVSMEVSPLLADDTSGSIKAAARIYRQADRRNLFVKIPGTAAGNLAIEESIFAGVPINVTLLFSSKQYLASAHAYLRGIERRIDAGFSPHVACVASLFVSRWDKEVNQMVPGELRNRLGIAVAAQTYRTYRELLSSPRWQGLAVAGARPQRLLWASTGAKDPHGRDTLYVEALAAPDTINTIPEKTLLAFSEHGELGGLMPEDGGNSEAVLARFEAVGVDINEVAAKLRSDGARAFVKSWGELLQRIAEKGQALARTENIETSL
jgi:transaldolase